MFSLLRYIGSIALFSFAMATAAFAQDGRSLKWAPADTAIYFSSMNNDVKFDAVLGSEAFKEFANNELISSFWQGLQTELQDGLRQGFERELTEETNEESKKIAETFLEWLNSDQAVDVWELTKELFENEFFFFADGKVVDVYRQAIRMQMHVMQEQMSNPEFDEDSILKYVRENLSNELASFEVPNIVVGGVLENPGRARKLLKELSEVLEAEMEKTKDDDSPIAAQDVYRYEVDGDDVLLGFHIKSEDVDWERIFQDADEKIAEMKEQIVEGMHGKSIAFGLAVREDALILSVGSSFDHLDELGSGDRLIDRTELKPLREHINQKLASVVYLSEEFAQAGTETNFLEVYFNSMFQSIRTASNNFDGNDKLANQLAADVEEFGKDMNSVIPKPGAQLQFSILVDNGIEGFAYDWSENRTFDGSKPLSILSHVGGNPAMMWAGRTQFHMEDYDLGVKWARRIFDRIREHVPQQMDDSEDSETFLTFMKDLRSILSDANQTTRDKWIPATADGQSAFVLDFSLAKSSWHPMMPSGSDVVPLPGIATVAVVSDATLFREASGEYLDQIQMFVDLLGTLPDSQIPPNFEVPRPKSREIENGTMYYYPFLDQVGLDPDLLPNAALNDELVVMTMSPVHSERLLNKSRLQVDGPANSPLSDTDRPLMSAMHYNNDATMDAIHQWVVYGYDMYQQFAPSPNDFQPGPSDEAVEDPTVDPWMPAQDPDEIMEVVDVSINLLKCFQSYSATTYIEGDAQVTHFLMHFKDTGKQ